MANAEAFRLAADTLRRRTAPSPTQWVKAHASEAGNEGVARLAGAGARAPREDGDVPSPPDTRFTAMGAKLSILTEAVA